MQVAGAVLAGGASTRMGRTKSLIEVRGTPMGRMVVDALTAGGCRPVAVVGGEAGLGCDLVADRYPGEGPLGGILTALAHFEAVSGVSHVLVSACDLPFLDESTVRNLLAAAAATPDAAAVVAHSGRRDPGLVVWNQQCFADIAEAFSSGTRAVHAVLEQVATVELPVDPHALRNVNRPDDLPGQ